MLPPSRPLEPAGATISESVIVTDPVNTPIVDVPTLVLVIRESRIVTLAARIASCAHRIVLPTMTVPAAVMVQGPVYDVNTVPSGTPVLAAPGHVGAGGDVVVGVGVGVTEGWTVGWTETVGEIGGTVVALGVADAVGWTVGVTVGAGLVQPSTRPSVTEQTSVKVPSGSAVVGPAEAHDAKKAAPTTTAKATVAAVMRLRITEIPSLARS
jgi:hypothetical protein